MEEFMPILGYEGLYEINNIGIVRSVQRNVIVNKNKYFHIRKKPYKYLKSEITNLGYIRICLYKNNIKKKFFVHRLVYESINGKIPNGLFINHINNNRSDNNISNLEIVTPKQNTAHMFKQNRQHKRSGELHPQNKLTVSDILKIRKSIKIGISQKALAFIYGVSTSCICSIYKKRSWSHVKEFD